MFYNQLDRSKTVSVVLTIMYLLKLTTTTITTTTITTTTITTITTTITNYSFATARTDYCVRYALQSKLPA